jgi:uncharacterized membrane protein YdbT with pleckstrin-like domain
MSYVQSTLLPREHVVYEGHLSLWAMSVGIFLGVVTLPIFGFGLLVLLAAFIRYRSTEMAVTNRRVIAKFGFVSRETVELSLQRIESVQVHQGVFGRLFNYGTLVVAGAGMPSAPIQGVSAPLEFRRKVFESQEGGTVTPVKLAA